LILAAASPAWGARRAHFTAGGSYLRPLDSTVRSLYDSGPGLFAGVGYAVRPDLAVEARADWYQSSATPGSFLARQSRSRLRIVPITLQAQWRPILARADSGAAIRLSPLLSLGPALVLVSERFTYGIYESSNQVTGERARLGAALGAGLAIEVARVAVRVEARALLSGGGVEALRPNGQSHERDDSAKPSLVSFGLGLELR